MIDPLLADDAFLADVESVRGEPGPHLWWLGQSGFLLQSGGRYLLFDPYLSDSLTSKYARTDKPHVRMTRRVIAPERLSFVDAVLCTHGHTDHLDAETILPIVRERERGHEDRFLIVPRGVESLARERLQKGMPVLVPLNATEECNLPGWKITAVPAAHEKIESDADGNDLYLGYIVQFDGFCIYHSGDTVLFDGMADRLRPFDIDVAILPINGRAPERRVAGNLNGPQSAQLAHDMAAKLVIPCHFEMFEFNTARPDEFVRACERLDQPYRVLRAGERWSAPPRSGSS